MRQAREIARLKFLAGVPTRAIARQLGVAASTVRETLRRFEGAGLGWPLPNGMSDGDLEAALYANHGTNEAIAASAFCRSPGAPVHSIRSGLMRCNIGGARAEIPPHRKQQCDTSPQLATALPSIELADGA
jgi:hypothetical protein